MHLRDWYDLTRLDHGFLWGIAVLVGEGLAYRGFPPLSYVILGFTVPVLIEVGIFAMNDYLDVESDVLNNRTDRPLTRHAIPQQYPLYLSLAVLPLSVVLGFFTGLSKPFFIVVVFVILGVLYNVRLKGIPMVKNVVMGLCIAAPLIWGNLVIREEILPVIIVFAAAAFTSGFGREVLKDMMDTVGDKATGCTTLPVLFGLKSSAVVVSLLFLAAGFFILLPSFYYLDTLYYRDVYYLIPAGATFGIVCFYVHSLLKDTSYENVKRLRKRTLNILEMGILTFVLGAIL